MIRTCGNCINLIILPSCASLRTKSTPACSQWSPDAKVILWQQQQEKQNQATITAMVEYLSEKCHRCPGYRKGEQCLMVSEGRDDGARDGGDDESCRRWIREYFTGKSVNKETKKAS